MESHEGLTCFHLQKHKEAVWILLQSIAVSPFFTSLSLGVCCCCSAGQNWPWNRWWKRWLGRPSSWRTLHQVSRDWRFLRAREPRVYFDFHLRPYRGYSTWLDDRSMWTLSLWGTTWIKRTKLEKSNMTSHTFPGFGLSIAGGSGKSFQASRHFPPKGRQTPKVLEK